MIAAVAFWLASKLLGFVRVALGAKQFAGIGQILEAPLVLPSSPRHNPRATQLNGSLGSATIAPNKVSACSH